MSAEILGSVSAPTFTGMKTLVHEENPNDHKDYFWVALSFAVIVVVGACGIFLKYYRARRKKSLESEKFHHQNYNTFNNMKKALGPNDLSEAMEKGVIAPYSMKSPSMRQVKSCPNFGAKDAGLFQIGQRKYSGSYLNMLKLDPISEDTDAEEDQESYEA
mmetsp:Transcript_6063/g.8412  ORF Transcript_6063/g.8412 Transcript_6063/m.8412 type:complete len:160 (+) Transcript_6063:75-554(+)|eukprot:CAMPEP_0184479614 /NCGR_PEP_ID=MMETSP0113_2-20130426/1271_1 /TAXON_ID=91329 /ORGANISM="Norrisiella sphaerica, Strain BC52" /LENGTH=159 /DNA_ID=CAMNT_0026857735 /DNA_START=76 /DNA_END=555 /DNA_ORIENTATION=-